MKANVRAVNYLKSLPIDKMLRLCRQFCTNQDEFTAIYPDASLGCGEDEDALMEFAHTVNAEKFESSDIAEYDAIIEALLDTVESLQSEINILRRRSLFFYRIYEG